MMKRLRTALLLAAAPAAAFAQLAPGSYARSHDQVVPSFEHLLFPPELVMKHQAALKLTPQQRTTISDAVKALQSHSIDVQWELQDEQKKLMDLLAQRPIPEGAVTAQINKLLELESTVKRAHLTALVRIKNALTQQQVDQLTSLRGQWHENDELFSQFLRTPPPSGVPPFEWDGASPFWRDLFPHHDWDSIAPPPGELFPFDWSARYYEWLRPDTYWSQPGYVPRPPVTPPPPIR
jgi:Spy/CpxP family protein refolding chaperone